MSFFSKLSSAFSALLGTVGTIVGLGCLGLGVITANPVLVGLGLFNLGFAVVNFYQMNSESKQNSPRTVQRDRLDYDSEYRHNLTHEKSSRYAGRERSQQAVNDNKHAHQHDESVAKWKENRHSHSTGLKSSAANPKRVSKYTDKAKDFQNGSERHFRR